MLKRFGTITCIAATITTSLVATAQERAECGQRVSRTNLVSCALAASLPVRSEEKNTEAIQGRRVAVSSVLPSNPVLALTGARREARGLEPTAFNWTATLSQEIQIAGQRGTRLKAIDAELSAQEKRVLLTRRETAFNAWVAFFDAIGSREEQRLAERLLQTSQRMATVSRARAEKGVGAAVEADMADAATLRVLQLKVEADRSVNSSQARLEFLLGRDRTLGVLLVEGDLTPLGGLPQSAPMMAHAVGERPEIQVLDAEQKANVARADAFRRARIPNPTISTFAQNDGYNERVLGVGLSLPIPLPTPIGRTFAGEIAEAEALAERAEIERSQVERELRLNITNAYASYNAHRQLVENLTPERLKRADETLRDLGAEIEAGRLAVRDALLAQQTLIELLRTNILERKALCVASVELARALGLALDGGGR